jgi:hypothetical protein
MAANDALFILVAPYESVAEASTDLAVLAALYAEPPAARTLDAVAVVRDAYGQVLLVEQPQGHRGPEICLSLGVAATLFPPIGVGAALTVPGGGSTIGMIVRHLHADIPREELDQLADMLQAAEAGLVVVYDEAMAPEVEARVSSESHTIIRASDVDLHELVRDVFPLSGPAFTEK